MGFTKKKNEPHGWGMEAVIIPCK